MNFGYGMHACFGRFFATHMIKILLAHLLVNYDLAVKVAIPIRNIVIRSQRIGNPLMEILFRRHSHDMPNSL